MFVNYKTEWWNIELDFLNYSLDYMLEYPLWLHVCTFLDFYTIALGLNNMPVKFSSYELDKTRHVTNQRWRWAKKKIRYSGQDQTQKWRLCHKFTPNKTRLVYTNTLPSKPKHCHKWQDKWHNVSDKSDNECKFNLQWLHT